MFAAMKKFRADLDSGRLCLGSGISVSDPAVTEALGPVVDFVWLDLEHTPLGLESLQAHLMAARATVTPAIVRVPSSDIGMIKRVIDTGAPGVLVPQVTSAEEVRRVVEACRYTPQGSRGYGPRRAANYGHVANETYLAEANAQLFVAVQIENRGGYDALDEILQIDGLDSIALGPHDLAFSLGKPGQLGDPEVRQAIESIVSRARAAGRYVGSGMDVDPEFAVYAASIGCQWLQVGGELGYMIQTARDAYARIRSRVS